MPHTQIGHALRVLLKLEQAALAIAGADDPKLAARHMGFSMLVVDAMQPLRLVPVNMPGLLAAQNLWLALERCATCFVSFDARYPRDVEALRYALAELRPLAEVVRVTLGDELEDEA